MAYIKCFHKNMCSEALHTELAARKVPCGVQCLWESKYRCACPSLLVNVFKAHDLNFKKRISLRNVHPSENDNGFSVPGKPYVQWAYFNGSYQSRLPVHSIFQMQPLKRPFDHTSMHMYKVTIGQNTVSLP